MLGVFRQAIATVAEGGVVVVIADTRIKADTLDDLCGVQPFDLRIGVKLVEIGDAQRKVGGPKALGIPGAGSYLYPMFVRFGVIITAKTPGSGSNISGSKEKIDFDHRIENKSLV